MTGPRDWDKEMADIDRLMASDKPPPPAAAPNPAAVARSSPSAPTVARSESVQVTRKRDALAVWLKVVLGALGGAALLYWPYGKGCGPQLYLYLVGVTAVAAAGIWAMRGSWTHRRGLAHVVGLLVFLLGVGLAAAEILPRMGYTAVAQSWTCT
ncbi:MAG: hypothetical protein ABJC19_11860 [Gemmatimonadota bacterium]